MHRNTGGLVDHQQMAVLENDRPLQQFQQAARGPPGLALRIDAHRRQAHLVAFLNAVFGFDALAIDPHLALAQQPVNAAARHGFEVPHQKVVDALTGLIFGHRAQGQRALWAAQTGQIAGWGIHCLAHGRSMVILRY